MELIGIQNGEYLSHTHREYRNNTYWLAGRQAGRQLARHCLSLCHCHVMSAHLIQFLPCPPCVSIHSIRQEQQTKISRKNIEGPFWADRHIVCTAAPRPKGSRNVTHSTQPCPVTHRQTDRQVSSRTHACMSKAFSRTRNTPGPAPAQPDVSLNAVVTPRDNSSLSHRLSSSEPSSCLRPVKGR